MFIILLLLLFSAHTLSLHFLWSILTIYVIHKCCVPAGVAAALRAKCAVVVGIVVVFENVHIKLKSPDCILRFHLNVLIAFYGYTININPDLNNSHHT